MGRMAGSGSTSTSGRRRHRVATICLLSLGLVASEMAAATIVATAADAAPAPSGPTPTFQKGNPSADPATLPALPSAPAPAKDPAPSGDFSFDPNLPKPADWAPPPTQGFVAGQSQKVASQTSSTREVFTNPDGTVTEQLSTSPVRYKDTTGTWEPFDDALSSKAGRLVPAGAPAGTSIAATADSTSVAQATTIAGPVGLEQPGAKPVAAKINGGEATFAGALGAGTDLVLRTLPIGFETTVVVSNAQVSSFAQTLNVPVGVTARNGGPGVELVDGTGKVVGTYGSGMASDAAAHPQDAEVLTRLVSQTGTKVQVSVSVDPKWLADPARVFPVAIDPTFSQYAGDTGAMDTYVSNTVNTPQSTNTLLRLGKVYGGAEVRRVLMKFDVSSLVGPNRQVISADLSLDNMYAPSCTTRPVEVRSLATPFTANTVWSNQPGYGATTITSPAFAKGYNSSCPAGFQSIDIATLAQKWIDGSANSGIGIKAVSETDDLAGKSFYSGETIGAGSLTITYNRPPTTNAVPSTPAAGATVSTTRPTLTVTPGVDPDGDPLQYWWSVGTSPDPTTGTVLASGWQPAGQTSWTVPAGSLVDGTTYYWTVSTWDGKSWPAPAPAARAFSVDTRLGAGGLSPMDAVGPAQVNLVSPAFSGQRLC